MMKTRIECDGCGKSVEIEPGGHSDEVAINCLVSVGGGADDKFDLCRGCQQRLKDNANPKSWPRPVAEA